MTKPPFTLIIAVSLHLAYSSASHVRFFLYIYISCTYKVELVREVSGIICVVKNSGGGETMQSQYVSSGWCSSE